MREITVQPASASASHTWKVAIAVTALVIVSISFLFLPVARWIEATRGEIQTLGWIGDAAFVVVYALMTVLLIPGTALTIAAGLFFGLVWGTFLAVVASNIGALAAFLLARNVLRQRVEAWAKERPKFSAINDAIAASALKVVMLLRLSPIFPFTLLNYLLGLTRISVTRYLLGSMIGMLPGTVALVYIGSLSASLATASTETESARKVRLALKILGLIATVIATYVITRIARKALTRTVSTTESSKHDKGAQ